MSQVREAALLEALVGELGPRRGGALRWYLPYLLDGLDFAGRRVLDVGGGYGECSFLAAARGARAAICLEPEAAGATSGCQAVFERLAAGLGTGDDVRLHGATWQDYPGAAEPFDIVLFHNSIHHLDEAHIGGVGRRAEDDEAYRALLGKLTELTTPAAQVIIADASRRNLWTTLGLRNPLLPQLVYPNHPEPEAWIRLLAAHGFGRPRLRWLSPRRLGPSAATIVGTRLGAWLTTAHYRLDLARGQN